MPEPLPEPMPDLEPEQVRVRREKYDRLVQAGTPPYPLGYPRTASLAPPCGTPTRAKVTLDPGQSHPRPGPKSPW